MRAEGIVGAGEVLGIHGPSGSGKSTLLRILAGLEPGARGEIRVHGTPWMGRDGQTVPAYRRRCALVAQRPIFFDHLDVRDNLAFGRRRRGLPDDARLFDLLLDVLHLDDLLRTDVTRLSGGEMQRLAIARALYSAPDILLLDEPLTGLDDDRKQRIVDCLLRLRGELRTPTLFVSHHVQEHAWMSDRMVFVDRGRFSESFDVGAALRERGLNVLDGLLVDDDSVRLDVDERILRVRERPPGLVPGDRVRILLPAEQILLADHSVTGLADQALELTSSPTRLGDHLEASVGRLTLVLPAGSRGRTAHFNLHPHNLRRL
nr:ATP-binding cassette domain-containing protein [Wenzhouxiangella sp. XN79A]